MGLILEAIANSGSVSRRTGDWLVSLDEHVRKRLTGKHFASAKANEGGLERYVILLSDLDSYEPSVDICVRSSQDWGDGIRHQPHDHHLERSRETGVDAVTTCRINKTGWVLEFFGADRDLLVQDPLKYSCSEPFETGLQQDLRRRGFIDEP